MKTEQLKEWLGTRASAKTNLPPETQAFVANIKEHLLSLGSGVTIREADYGFDLCFPWFPDPIQFLTREYRVDAQCRGQSFTVGQLSSWDEWVIPKYGNYSVEGLNTRIATLLGHVYPDGK